MDKIKYIDITEIRQKRRYTLIDLYLNYDNYLIKLNELCRVDELYSRDKNPKIGGIIKKYYVNVYEKSVMFITDYCTHTL